MTSSRLVAALLFGPVALCASGTQMFEAVEPHMGTLFRIELYASGEAEAQAAFRAAFERVRGLDEMLSDYKPDSELNQLPVRAVGTPVKVSPDLYRVLSAGQALASETGGAFDVTLGPLTHLWRAARKSGQVPDEQAIRSAADRCGYRKLHLRDKEATVSLDAPGMQLDLGGIAKGYAADAALEVLSRLGITSALVAASGDLAFSDAPPGKAGWSIGIDSADGAGEPFTATMMLRNAAVSTSGDSQQHLDAGGRRYSHVLDPRTGMGLTNGYSVTAIARRGVEADALTKVVSVWGPEKGLRFIDERPGARALVADKSTRPVKVWTSKRWNEGQGDPPDNARQPAAVRNREPVRRGL